MKGRLGWIKLVAPIMVWVIGFLALPGEILSNPPGFGKSLGEVVKLAEKEGRVRIASGLQEDDAKRVLSKFHQKYPGITVENTYIGGSDNDRVFTELMGGRIDYDAINIASEVVSQFKKGGVITGPFDWRTLAPNIPKEHFSPDGYFAAVGFITYLIGYNPTLVPRDKAPKDWKDCLDPYWKGKVVVDTRPKAFTALYPAWGEKKTLEFASQLKENQPVWKRGQTAVLTQIVTGEYPMLCGAYYQSMLRILTQDPQAKLAVVWPSEVPGHLTEIWTVVKGAKYPNAALLISSWLVSREGREEYDRVGIGSPFFQESRIAKLIKEARAKPVFGGWRDDESVISQKIVATWGFSPKK